MKVSVAHGGSGYSPTVGVDDVDILYADTNTSQILSVTSIKIEAGGSGFIPGAFQVIGGDANNLARGTFEVTDDTIASITISGTATSPYTNGVSAVADCNGVTDCSGTGFSVPVWQMVSFPSQLVLLVRGTQTDQSLSLVTHHAQAPGSLARARWTAEEQ